MVGYKKGNAPVLSNGVPIPYSAVLTHSGLEEYGISGPTGVLP